MVKNMHIKSIENSKGYFKKDEESEHFGDILLVIYDKINELIDEINDLKKEDKNKTTDLEKAIELSKLKNYDWISRQTSVDDFYSFSPTQEDYDNLMDWYYNIGDDN